MNNQQRAQIADELRTLAQPPRLQPDEITIRQYADRHGIKYDRASLELEKLLKEGTVTRRLVLHDGKHRWAYRPTHNNADSPQD